MNSLALTFVLPKLIDHPIGGYKVHYQYANGLAKRGHKVTLVHPISGGPHVSPRDRVNLWRALRAQRRTGRPPIGWFKFDGSVRSVLVPVLDAQLPVADATILTAWQTAARTVRPAPRAGRMVQIVYDYEFWMSEPELRGEISSALGRSDVLHIATSGVVGRMLEEIGAPPVTTIQAGLNEGEFGVDVVPEERDLIVGFARRFQPSKDGTTALSAVQAVHDAMPAAKIICFGHSPEGAVPPWVESLGTLTHDELRRFYNRCSIFLLTSRFEGWGLPALEAMACGAAVVSTSSGGVEDFMVDGSNGLLVPVADAAAIASATVGLLTDEARRQRIARQAAIDASSWTMARSIEQLEAVLASEVEAAG